LFARRVTSTDTQALFRIGCVFCSFRRMKSAALLMALFLTTAHAQSPSSPTPAPQTPPSQRSAAAGSTAATPEDPQAARRLFRELDRNGDGYLTSDELWSERGRDGNWAAVDRNRDGRISTDEFTVLRRR